MVLSYIVGKKIRSVMSHSAEKNGIVNQQLETAINIGCTIASKSKKVRKKLNSSTDDSESVKKSLKELDRMSMALIDQLFQINARMDRAGEKKKSTGPGASNFRLLLNTILKRSMQSIEKMRLTYQDIHNL